MENKTTTTGDALAKDIKTLTDDISSIKDDLAKIARDAKKHAGAHVDAGRELVSEKIQLAREAAAARPLLILAVGFFLGFIFALRGRK